MPATASATGDQPPGHQTRNLLGSARWPAAPTPGKSTLLQLAGTLDRRSSGSVRVTGLDVTALGDRELAGLRARRIGFVFQQFFLAEHQRPYHLSSQVPPVRVQGLRRIPAPEVTGTWPADMGTE